MSRFGAFFKQKRLELGLSLRRFCLEHGLDPGNISKLERGRLAPPQHDPLSALGVFGDPNDQITGERSDVARQKLLEFGYVSELFSEIVSVRADGLCL